MLNPFQPALILAPMDGVTDATMRSLIRTFGVFDFAVSEFVRVSNAVIPKRVFLREIPELLVQNSDSFSMPVQVQLLGSDPARMGASAINAVKAGTRAIDINFGCPAPTVNRNEGGASLLRYPCKIRDIVAAVREAVPDEMPVSAKLRLGWDCIDDIHENAAMAAEGGASWLTIHARTKAQGYAPPVHWKAIGRVRNSLSIPVVANGDIQNLHDFHRCREETGCIHFMIGRGALANPTMLVKIRDELGVSSPAPQILKWDALFTLLVDLSSATGEFNPRYVLGRLKQWSKIAHAFGDFPPFHTVKSAETVDEFFDNLRSFDAVLK